MLKHSLIMLCLPGLALGSHCGTVASYRRHHIVHKKVDVAVYPELIPATLTFFQWLPALQPIQAPIQTSTPVPPGDPGQNLPPIAAYEGEQTQPINTSAQDLSLARTRCASCHTEGTQKGGFTLFLRDGNLNPQANLRRAHVRVEEGTMPPGGPLSEQEKQQFWENLR